MVRSLPVPPHDARDTGPMPPSKSNVVQVPKRTRSPPLPSSNEVVSRNSHSIQDDTEREAQAKAKRLARFNIELSNPVLGTRDITKQKPSGAKNDSKNDIRKFIVKHPIQEADLSNSGPLFDDEGAESSSVVVGLCPDMCPESERAERERKGDLDKYERVDGDRNQTSLGLAVKKYNRMAEREADLIRPLPVLQKTVDYLLSLLDQPYDDNFLGMYNFLWDRMRAIRMDLRMQHIFNQDAITMLEQMIRLHIIAMHELCEYTKGEGFAEGFDAHLNIEQMNKASVELFQLYDDHRKKGSSIPTEKEFRGYYALLKLDKHPGYKVERAELSLDLAKMTPEIRSAPEILFAREVARHPSINCHKKLEVWNIPPDAET
ncbi:SAC3 protein B [Asimina triloba]